MRSKIAWFLFAAVLTAGSLVNGQTQSQSVEAGQPTPRAKYILAFDFVKGEAKAPYPTREALGVPPGLSDTARITRMIYANDLEGYVSKYVKSYRQSWNVWPYSLSDLKGKEVDKLVSRECLGNSFFWPLSNNFDVFGDASDSQKQLDALMYKRLAEQFIDFIDADEELSKIILASDYLFSTEEGEDLNKVLHEAWKTGRLTRPALMEPAGECSPDWAEYRVKISFKSNTQRIFYISAGDFRLCTIAEVEPWDAAKCKGGPWEFITTKEGSLGMFGNYYFKVQSSDGQETVIGPVQIDGDKDIKL